MDSKAAEASRPPPSYDESAAQPSNHQQTPHMVVNMAPAGATQCADPPAMFLTARMSVYGAHPVEMDCPHCQAHIVTHIDRVAGVLPWLIFGACVVLGFFLFLVPWCFCCLPFFTDQCLDVLHSCPNCKRHLGRHSRM